MVYIPAGPRNFNVGVVLADRLLGISIVKAIKPCSNNDDKDKTEFFVLTVGLLNFPLQDSQVTVHLSVVIIFIRIHRIRTRHLN